jgi:hypothetical protein
MHDYSAKVVANPASQRPGAGEPGATHPEEYRKLRRAGGRRSQWLRTRYPDDSIPVKSVVDITRGVWTRETVEAKETSAAKKSNGDALREILRQNPGIGVNEFESKAKDAKIGQAFFRNWKTEMITTGNIHVTSGPNRSQLLTWDDTVPETVAKVSLLSNLRLEDIPEAEFDFKK